MKKALVTAFAALVIVISGCASSDYRGHSSPRYQETLPGVSARGSGAIFGGIVGAIISDALGLNSIQTAGVAVGGALLGAGIGGPYDEAARQAGRTNCRWRYSGYVDPSGRPHQQSGGYDCSGGNSTYGNRNYPPHAWPQ